MYTLDELYEQNRDIAQLCEVLSVLTTNPELHNNSYVIELMNIFRDKVWVHLVFEDKTVYAELARHDDETISDLAKEFHRSAIDTRKVFTQFMRDWQHRELGHDKKPLSLQCREIFEQILERTVFENEKMLPMIEEHQKLGLRQ